MSEEVKLPDWGTLTNEEVLRIAPMMGSFSDDERAAFCAGFRRCAQATADQLRAAVLEERERAANICEHMVAVSAVSYETGAACAAAIRKG